MRQPRFVTLERRKPDDSANILRSCLAGFLNFFVLPKHCVFLKLFRF